MVYGDKSSIVRKSDQDRLVRCRAQTRTKCAASAVSVARDLGIVWTLAPRRDQILKLQVTLPAS